MIDTVGKLIEMLSGFDPDDKVLVKSAGLVKMEGFTITGVGSEVKGATRTVLIRFFQVSESAEKRK